MIVGFTINNKKIVFHFRDDAENDLILMMNITIFVGKI